MVLIIILPTLYQSPVTVNEAPQEQQEIYFKFSLLGVYQDCSGTYLEFYLKAYNSTQAMQLSRTTCAEIVELNNLKSATVRLLGNCTQIDGEK